MNCIDTRLYLTLLYPLHDTPSQGPMYDSVEHAAQHRSVADFGGEAEV